MREIFYQLFRLVAALSLPLFFCGCSMLQAVNTLFVEQRKPATRVPLYVYRADLILTADGTAFDGIGVTLSQLKTDIDVQSQIHLDRVEVETCARQDVCEDGKYCNSNFSIDHGWFSSIGTHMVYHYTPSAIEQAGSCPIYIRVFDKAALAAWGFLAFRKNEDLPARFICNGVTWSFKGHSVCQTRHDLIQRISFDSVIEDFDADSTCGIKKIDDKSFEIRPQLGQCTAKFFAGGHWHGLDLIAYDEVLVRGT